MPTPSAPTISAIRLTRLRKRVARSRPRRIVGWISRKSETRPSSKPSSRILRASAIEIPSAGKPEQVALRGPAADAESARRAASPSWLIMTRGPTLNEPVMRSGSSRTAAATRNSASPRRTVSPTLDAEPQKQVVGADDGVVGQDGRKIARWIQLNLAVKRIFAGLDRLYRHQHRPRGRRRRHHRDCLGDFGIFDAALLRAARAPPICSGRG